VLSHISEARSGAPDLRYLRDEARTLKGLLVADQSLDDVAHLFLLGAQVCGEALLRHNFGGDALGDSDARGFERGDLVRIVGDETNLGEAEELEHLCGKLVFAAIGGEAKLNVSFYRVHSMILQLVGFQLGHEADAASLLLLVEQNARAF